MSLMKKLALGIFVLIMMGFAAKELLSSRNTKKEPEASGFKFYYYPKLNVYYDATQNNFVYTVDGGVTWQTKKPASTDLPEKLGEKVTIYSPDPDAWIYNSKHRKQYKGVATNYVQRPEDTAKFVAVATSPKIDSASFVKKDTVENSKSEENKKKGGSWFNRLKEKIKKGFKKNKEPQSDTL
jgi:hypothetical protein